MTRSADLLAERCARLASLRGANYLPSWSRSAYDAWGPSMQPEQLARELGYARGLGLNAIRVWLALDDPEELSGLVERVRSLLDAADHAGLSVVLVLFDSCGCEQQQQAPQVPIAAVPGLMADDPRWKSMLDWAGDRDLIGPHELIETPWVDDPMAVIWTTWRPMPDYDALKDSRARIDRREYVAALLSMAAHHRALVAVELVNEPFLSPESQGRDLAPIVAHYQDVYTVARTVAPGVPLGMGAANAADALRHDANLGGELDLVSLHCYGGAAELRTEIETAQALAAGRPVILSEWGCFPGLPDERHEQVYRERAHALHDLDVGWFLFHLIAGYGPFALSALIYPNGAMRPAARFLMHHLAGRPGP